MTASLADQSARDRIREDLGATLIVEAAAGTGKTTELVARIVALVQRGQTTLDRIVAVTFTDAAAGEMKLRLRSELEKARKNASPEEQERLTDALRKLEVASIGTIHSFCADLLREWSVDAGVDPSFEIAAGDSQDRLFREAFDSWFQRTIGDPPEGVRRFLRRRGRRNDHPPREQLRRAGFELAEHRDFDAPWSRPPFDRTGGLERTVERLRALGEVAARAAHPDDRLSQSLAEIERWVADLRRREEARGRDEDGLEAELVELSRRYWTWKEWGTGKWFAQGLARQDVLKLRDAVKADLDAFIELSEADLAAALKQELRPLCAAYEELKAKSGCLDFLDLLLRARDLVRDDRGVREKLQARFTHVLVDEFQDTDPLQAEILMLLAADDPAETNWRRVRPKAGKLFVVGDPKQSIYRFRRADIALYEDVKGVVLARGGEMVHLTTSFRSVPGIQEAVNAAFAPRMQGGTQAAYVPLDRFRPAPVGRPQVVALPAPRLYSDWGRVVKKKIEESYPDAVAAFVDFLIRKSGWTVTERDDATRPVPLEARHICLLFKRMRAWGTDLTRSYVRALEARRIPHVLVGGHSFHAREEVLALRNAAQAIEWPDDELSVFAVLRGPLFALGDDALLLFRERQRRLHPLRRFEELESLSPQEREVAEALALLGKLHLRRNRQPIAQTFVRLLEATRAHAGIAIWPTGEQALANVLRVLELARRFESAGATSFRAFVEQLALDADRDEAAEAPVVEEGTDGVRVMTVHKAKGLEFPVVILCDPTAPPAMRMPTHFIDPERRLWALPLAGCVPADLLQNREAVVERDREEGLRVAYVAATRARDLLVVPAQGDGEPDCWLEVLSPAIYPKDLERRRGGPAEGCPPFGAGSGLGEDGTVLDRPERVDGPSAVSPGLHVPQAGGHGVVWWDPRSLELGIELEGGIRSQDLLVEDESSRPAAQAARSAHEEWKARRTQGLEAGSVPSLRVTTATALSMAAGKQAPVDVGEKPEALDASAKQEPLRAGGKQPPVVAGGRQQPVEADGNPPAVDAGEKQQPVELAAIEKRDASRPRGKRFGTLVHAILERVDLRAGLETIRRVAVAEGRLVGATEEEVQAAGRAASAALQHPLLVRAAKSADYRRQTSVLHRLPDGTIVEGFIDLAFREESPSGPVWTVLDFKTDATVDDQQQYAAQLRLYCAAVSAATNEATRAILMSV